MSTELKSKLINIAASMTKGRHLRDLQIVSETNKRVSARKIQRMVEEVEDKQRLDAIFLKKVFDYVIKLEKQSQ